MTLERWTGLTEWPVMLVAFTCLAGYSWEVLSPGTIPSRLAHTTLQGVWLLFVARYVVSLALAPERRSWFFRNLHELVIVTLPMLRPLRLLTALNVLHRVAGIALLGVVTATLASWLIQQVTEEERSTVVTVAHVERLSRELSELRDLLAQRPQHPEHFRSPE